VRRPLVLLLLTSVALLGCGNVSSSREPVETLLHQETKEGIAFELKLDRNTFELGDEIAVEATATNTSDKSVHYQSGSSTCPTHILLSVESEETGRRLIPKPSGESRPCTDDINVSSLEPGQSVSETAVFFPYEWIHSGQEEAYGGKYGVEASIRLTESGLEDVVLIRTSIIIKGTGLKIISAERAEEIALGHKDTKKWILNHSGERISKIVDGEHYLLWGDKWFKASEEEYERLRNGIYDQEKTVSYKDGTWTVRYVSKLGGTPSVIEIIVDAQSEKIIEIRLHER
jgi:hypothetical protein